MDNRESKAAAMRQTWLGDAAGEAVPWNELKQCVRDRWLAALDAAQPEGAAPPSDEIIERMAEGAQKTMWRCGATWPDAIRAALAAVGPQYCPADVAFNSRVPELEKAAERLTERLAAVSAKSHRRKVALKQMQHGLAAWKAVATHYRQSRRNHEVNYNAMQAERDALRAELAQAEIELADKSFYVREFAAVSAERDGLKKRNDVQAEQLIRIDSEISPLMSEVAELKAERDAARAELAEARAALESELAAEVAENVRLRTREVGDEVGNLLQEVADLKNQLARVKAESLRVVKVGPEITKLQAHCDPLVEVGLDVAEVRVGSCRSVMTRQTYAVLPDTRVQPVRLEHWEASHDHH